MNEEEIAKKYHLDSHYPTVLFLSGGKGSIDIPTAVKHTLLNSANLNIIAISGKNNPKLYQKLSAFKTSKNNYQVIKFTDTVDELMRIADVIITKPGGLTVSECLFLKKPLILTNPIPGQEEKNAEFVLNSNFGFLAQNTTDVFDKIKLLLKNKSILSTPRETSNPSEIILKQK